MNKEVWNKIIIGSFVLVVAIIGSALTAQAGGDFDIYLDASRRLGLGENIYSNTHIKGLQYFYSVFFALLFVPFSNHIFLTEMVWSLISFFLLYRTFKLMEVYFDFTIFTKKQKYVWIGLTLFLATQFILYNVSMIQITIFLMWAMFESLKLLLNGKNVYAGTLLGLVINIKIMPVLLLPYLFYRGYFKALLVAMVTFVALLFLPAIFIGYDYNNFLLSEWWAIINPGKKEHLFETGLGSNSLVALLPVYLTETVGEIDMKRNILNMSHQHVEWIINGVRLFVFSLSLFYLRSFPFKKEVNKLKIFWEVSFFIFMIPLLLPHQQKYSFLLAIPMVSYLIYFFIATKPLRKSKAYYIAFCTFVVSMILYTPFYGSDFMGTFLFEVTLHYRFLTLATLLIIPVSMYCSPLRLSRSKEK